jgi:hypothetical protein
MPFFNNEKVNFDNLPLDFNFDIDEQFLQTSKLI